jgi:hypothetical protein
VSALEQQVRIAWIGWGSYAGFHVCSGCRRFVYCRARTYGTKWLCLDCWDQR